jgi:hypothetical protein
LRKHGILEVVVAVTLELLVLSDGAVHRVAHLSEKLCSILKSAKIR